MIKITQNDKVSIKYAGHTNGYDGHCLRAYSYFPEQMPDITSQLEEVHKEGKVYKVTLDSGEVKYFNEFNSEFLRIKENATDEQT